MVIFNDTATTEIYTLSLHDALPISAAIGCDVDAAEYRLPFVRGEVARLSGSCVHEEQVGARRPIGAPDDHAGRSEEHTSELQSRQDLVCRLLLEHKKAID